MKWNVLSELKIKNEKGKIGEEIVKILLENRGIKSSTEQERFLNPQTLDKFSAKDVGFDSVELKKSLKRIQDAIASEEPIVIYGDYDVDGICSSAILWESLRDLGANVLPFIPDREKEGYGLSIEGIKNILANEKYKFNKVNKINKVNKKRGLIISVDSGIVAFDAVEFANENEIDVIILDHHEKSENLPEAFAIIHTQELCAGGISYFFARELCESLGKKYETNHLELACIATVADLVPLVKVNRSIVKFGVDSLNETSRLGLLSLFEVAGIKKVGVYEIGYQIAPRINASGRISSALVGLRLLCTKDKTKAKEYASELDRINKERQGMVEEMVAHAFEMQNAKSKTQNYEDKLIIIEHESYHQGIIGLIAGKLVEKYYLPSIVIAKGEKISKASARSISGFNIINAIRIGSDHLLGAGGHPMAAGFSIESSKITDFKVQVLEYAKEAISVEMLERSMKVDMELGLEHVSEELYGELSKLAPYGIGNSEPVFCAKAKVLSFRAIGSEGKHLKLQVASEKPSDKLDVIAFGMGDLAMNLHINDIIELSYNIDINEYMGNRTLQLKAKDIHYGDLKEKNKRE